MNRHLFINCPFSKDYQHLFYALVFTTLYCGFKPRCALETDDGSENRFDKICDLIKQCRLGVHDISKTELDRISKLPRFNMPLELGLFLAAKKFGNAEQKQKKCLIFDREKYRYQQFMSDISGQDIHAHGGNVTQLIKALASWLRREFQDNRIAGGAAVLRNFEAFQIELPSICRGLQLRRDEVSFDDFRKIAELWIANKVKPISSKRS